MSLRGPSGMERERGSKKQAEWRGTGRGGQWGGRAPWPRSAASELLQRAGWLEMNWLLGKSGSGSNPTWKSIRVTRMRGWHRPLPFKTVQGKATRGSRCPPLQTWKEAQLTPSRLVQVPRLSAPAATVHNCFRPSFLGLSVSYSGPCLALPFGRNLWFWKDSLRNICEGSSDVSEKNPRLTRHKLRK